MLLIELLPQTLSSVVTLRAVCVQQSIPSVQAFVALAVMNWKTIMSALPLILAAALSSVRRLGRHALTAFRTDLRLALIAVEFALMPAQLHHLLQLMTLAKHNLMLPIAVSALSLVVPRA